MLDKSLKYITYAGVFALTLTPFIVTQNLFFPFITGKNFFFRIVVAVIFFAWALLAIRNREYRPKKSWILWSFAALLVSIGVSDLLSPNVGKSFWSNFERMEGWVTFLHLFAYFIVSSSVLNTKQLWQRFLNTSVAASIIVVGYSFLQLAGALVINQGGVRVDATFGNSAYLAIYMLFHVFITAFLLFERVEERRSYKGKLMDWLSWLYVPAIILQATILYFTATRGSILGLIGGVFVVFVLISLFEKNNKTIRKWSIAALIGVVAVVGLFFAIKDTSFVKDSLTLSRLSSISLTEHTTQSRFIVWGMAIDGFKEKPVFGWGQESFNYVFNSNYSPKMFQQEQWFDRAHNVFFDWLVSGGIVGIIFYLSLFLSTLYYLWRKREEDFSVVSKAILTGLLAGYFFHNLFVFDNIVSYILFFSILAFVHFYKRENSNEDVELRHVHGNFETLIAPALAIVLVVVSIYGFSVKGILAGQTLLGGLREISTSDFDAGLLSIQKSISYGGYGVQEAREQLVQTATTMANAQIPLETKQKYFTVAVDELEKEIEKDPLNARSEVFLGALYSRYGLYDDSIVHLERALELTPNKQNLMLELGSNYINKGEIEKGVEVFEKAFLLDESFELPRLANAMGAIYEGDTKKLEDLLVPVYGTTLVPNDFLIKAYFDTNQIGKVIELREAKVSLNPGDIQEKFSLAAAYLDAGRKNDALSLLEEVRRTSPQLKEQIDFYIKEINEGRTP